MTTDVLSATINMTLHQRQSECFASHATEQLYGGATYGGKSHLMRVAAIAWCTMIPGLQVYIFRRQFPDLYKNHMEGPTSFPMLLKPWINYGHCSINYGKNYISFSNGSKIHLCHCQHEKDMYAFDGPEIHVLMIDELTHFLETIYRYLRGRCRLGGLVVPPQYVGMFPRVLCGTNPGGVGHNWVKRTFIDLQPAMGIMQMPPEEGGFKRQFIPALASDNPTGVANDPNYMANQAGLGDSALVKAKRDGDWNIVAGGAFDDVWTPRVLVPRFPIPRTWRVDRSFDWGSTKPFSTLWFAETDGTEIWLTPDPRRPDLKRRFAPPKGSLIVIQEYYGAKSPNVGLKLGSSKVASNILMIEKDLVEGKWIQSKPLPGPADNAIDADLDMDQPSIKKTMADKGVHWTESDKSPGSRAIGLEVARAMLVEAGLDLPEDRCLFIMEHCRELISHLPVLPRDAKRFDDVDTAAEDHDWDALRYKVLSKKRETKQSALRV